MKGNDNLLNLKNDILKKANKINIIFGEKFKKYLDEQDGEKIGDEEDIEQKLEELLDFEEDIEYGLPSPDKNKDFGEGLNSYEIYEYYQAYEKINEEIMDNGVERLLSYDKDFLKHIINFDHDYVKLDNPCGKEFLTENDVKKIIFEDLIFNEIDLEYFIEYYRY